MCIRDRVAGEAAHTPFVVELAQSGAEAGAAPPTRPPLPRPPPRGGRGPAGGVSRGGGWGGGPAGWPGPLVGWSSPRGRGAQSEPPSRRGNRREPQYLSQRPPPRSNRRSRPSFQTGGQLGGAGCGRFHRGHESRPHPGGLGLPGRGRRAGGGWVRGPPGGGSWRAPAFPPLLPHPGSPRGRCCSRGAPPRWGSFPAGSRSGRPDCRICCSCSPAGWRSFTWGAPLRRPRPTGPAANPALRGGRAQCGQRSRRGGIPQRAHQLPSNLADGGASHDRTRNHFPPITGSHHRSGCLG